MAYGIRVMNAAGNIRWDMNDRLVRVVWEYTIPRTTLTSYTQVGSIFVPFPAQVNYSKSIITSNSCEFYAINTGFSIGNGYYNYNVSQTSSGITYATFDPYPTIHPWTAGTTVTFSKTIVRVLEYK